MFKEERAKLLPSGGQENPLAALCLSGGGIRSATFALGVLQGLARFGLLQHFHYLSTVSGGGYIGSWLTAWRHHAGSDAAVFAGLDRFTSATGKEAPEIAGLRANSNYLTPKLRHPVRRHMGGARFGPAQRRAQLAGVRAAFPGCVLFVPKVLAGVLTWLDALPAAWLGGAGLALSAGAALCTVLGLASAVRGRLQAAAALADRWRLRPARARAACRGGGLPGWGPPAPCHRWAPEPPWGWARWPASCCMPPPGAWAWPGGWRLPRTRRTPVRDPG